MYIRVTIKRKKKKKKKKKNSCSNPWRVPLWSAEAASEKETSFSLGHVPARWLQRNWIFIPLSPISRLDRSVSIIVDHRQSVSDRFPIFATLFLVDLANFISLIWTKLRWTTEICDLWSRETMDLEMGRIEFQNSKQNIPKWSLDSTFSNQCENLINIIIHRVINPLHFTYPTLTLYTIV